MIELLMVVTAIAASPTVDTTHEPIGKRTCNARCRRRRAVRPYNAKLERMAWCESTGRWWIATGNGYYGGLQFDLQTWQSVGGYGYPHHATRLEQKYRATILIRQRGYAPWPHCGYV